MKKTKMSEPFDREDETFYDLAFDTLSDYVDKPLVDIEGNRYYLESVDRHTHTEVNYWLYGMPIPWRSDIRKLLTTVGNDYGRAQARGLK